MLDSEQADNHEHDETNVAATTTATTATTASTSDDKAAAAAAANGEAVKTEEEEGDSSSNPDTTAEEGENDIKEEEATAEGDAAAATGGDSASKDDDDDDNQSDGDAMDVDNNEEKGQVDAPPVKAEEAVVEAKKENGDTQQQQPEEAKEEAEDVEMKDSAAVNSDNDSKKDDKNNTKTDDTTTAITANGDSKREVEKPEGEQEKAASEAPNDQSTSSPKGDGDADDATKEAAAAVEKDEEKKADGDKAKDGPVDGETPSDSAAAEAPAAAPVAPSPPPPVLKGTLSYNIDLRRHVIRGMWNYENSHTSPQRFELLRNLDKEEDPKVLPADGEFHGSFSLAYFHTTSKGKQKERSKVINEHGVNITFTKVEGTEHEYKVDGKGTNQFGIFNINGTASPSPQDGDDDPTEYKIVLQKRYEPSTPAPAGAAAAEGRGGGGGGSGGNKKRKNMDDGGPEGGDGLLPPPSKSHAKGVVCLRGKLDKEDAEDLGATDVVHRIIGMWSSSLDLLLADPQNVQGHSNRFEYEHKSTVPSGTFPVSGRYSGWFHLTTPEGTRTTIPERDVMLRFTKNNAGYHNVEGKGFNAFGKYTITGTLSMDNVITIFRHFKPIKVKASRTPAVTSAPPPINTGGQPASKRASQISTFPDPLLTMEEVKVPGGENGESLAPIQPPANTSYSAVSQGVLRLNEDGSHQCSGKWAVTREHFTSGQTSNFSFRLEPHFALEAVNEKRKKEGVSTEDSGATGAAAIPKDFPLDSALYKGSFQLKKKGNRYDTVVDQQIVMKFRKSSSGAYNVYGRGVNAIGTFNLIGTLVLRGASGGQVELYRMYPPELLVPQKPPAPAPGKIPAFSRAASDATAPLADSSMSMPHHASSSSGMIPGIPRGAGLMRRESTRLVKLPSRLEDDDPQAQLARVMEKCVVILRHIREKDIERGAFFSEPVDPVALGIPTYRQVITEPMDLGSVARKLEANQINTPEEFARLVRLTFENAITFNVDPHHSVHLSARWLLVEFNKKFRDIERLLESLRRAHKAAVAELDENKGLKKTKDGKKRKRSDQPKSAKRKRLDEAQAMAAANASAMAAIVAAAPQGVPNAAVSRGEFNMMIHMIQLLQKQIVQTHNTLAELFPGDESEVSNAPAVSASSGPGFDLYASLAPSAAPAPAPERKKPKKKAAPAEPVLQKIDEEEVEAPVFYDENRPLTLQEQESLTETINNMEPENIPGIIQIIRESASLAGDEDEIDLEIDQLDTVTQRKLLRHVAQVRPRRHSLVSSSIFLFEHHLMPRIMFNCFWVIPVY